MKINVTAAAIFAGLVLTATMAKADTFVWKDETGDYTMSFPDSWRVQTEDGPFTSLRIAGPVAEHQASCRMQVQDDGRIQIYTKNVVDEAVVEKLDQKFWQSQVGAFDSARIDEVYAPASLSGKGDATAIELSYLGPKMAGSQKAQMRGMMLASLYADKLYVISCTATREAYAELKPLFASIVDSVELKSKYHPFATGYYRNFLMDPKLTWPRAKPGTINEKNWGTSKDVVLNK